MICAIVAVGKNWGIGNNNKLLTRIPDDMKFFKEITTNNIIIMGRKTFDSINKPLPNRINCVVTSKTDSMKHIVDDNYYLMSMDYVKENLLSIFSMHDYLDVFVIGGGQIYKELLPYCDKIYVTKINYAFENVDTYFPNIDNIPEWEMESASEIKEYNSIEYQFCEYRKKV